MTTHDELAAYQALGLAKARYCRAIDTKDWAMLSGLMLEEVEFGMANDDATADMIVGRTSVIESLQQLTAGARTVHQVYNPEIELSGDEARVVWAVQDHAVYDNGFSVTGYGHYFERWMRVDDGWRVASVLLRHLIVDTASG
ncbi:nuclear transport factor 2 family protein [Mycolicibacterium sp. 120266]|uniref:nuclear transport factor 2 family protein n=1 Tax=Mycolicibacterium sp. 120266 TaxID=3090601 RepID=UPI00299DAD25|nr:nuclear transport factor 2 family protein [Mycolicibacterium sp. 120266]MDX1873911.1 nuclear transport factor 2 family protein [Mycolicibacterium sp. 120266]